MVDKRLIRANGRATREAAATELDIEGSLIAPRAILESIAMGDTNPADALLKWQRACLKMDA